MSKSAARTHAARLVQFAGPRPSYANGVRAAISTVAPIVAGQAFGWHSAMWMGLAGFNVSLADKGGAFRTRAAAMASTTAYGLLAAVVGAAVSGHPALVVATVAIWCFFASLARAWGQIATNAGVVSLVTLIVSVAAPAADLRAAWERGGAVAAGSLFAIVLALFLWPIRLYRPARLAVARAFRSVAAAIDSRERVAIEAAEAAIDDARTALAVLRRGLQGESPRGERLLVLVERAAQLLSSARPAAQSAAEVLVRLADGIERERVVVADDEVARELLPVVEAARELETERDRRPRTRSLYEQYATPLLGAMAWRSALLRHALRLAISGAIASAFTHSFHVPRGYWMTLTVVIILQPYVSATFQKGLQRVIGTIAGGVIAAVIAAVVHSPAVLIAIIFAGAAVTVAFLRINYALYSLFVTPTFVLLAELGATDRHLVMVRIANTVGGALLAYAAARVLWPASERGLVREEVTAAMHAAAEYLRCVECDDVNANEARRSWLIAYQNAEASVQRLLSEDRAGTDVEVEAFMALTVYLRRIGLAVNVPGKGARLRPDVARFAAASLNEAAGAIAQNRVPEAIASPDAGDDDAVVAPVNGVTEIASRLAAAR